MLSKSSGYALRALLHLSLRETASAKTSISDIARSLGAPQPFLAKLLQDLARNGYIGSAKGPNGGFFANDRTPTITVAQVVELIDSLDDFHRCAMGMPGCSPASPCPLHHEVAVCRDGLLRVFHQRTIGDMATAVRLKQAVSPDAADGEATSPVSPLSLASAINLTGKLRMLSQWLAKACVVAVYCGEVSLQQEMQQQQESASILFTESLRTLSLFAVSASPVYQQRMEQVEIIWKAYLAVLRQEPSRQQARWLLEQNTTLLSTCNEAVQTLENESFKPLQKDNLTTRILAGKINQAGAQRMRTQRIALYYAAVGWEVLPGGPMAAPELMAAIRDWESASRELLAFTGNSREQDQQLALALREWQRMELLSPEGALLLTHRPEDVVRGCDRLLAYMDAITLTYVQMLEEIRSRQEPLQ